MVFRFIGVVLELLWAIAKREAEIESLKRREDKSEQKLKVLSDKVRELDTCTKTLESRRESDNERIKALELRRDFQSEQIARLERWRDLNASNPKPHADVPLKTDSISESEDRPEQTLSELLQEIVDDAKRERQVVVAAIKAATDNQPTTDTPTAATAAETD